MSLAFLPKRYKRSLRVQQLLNYMETDVEDMYDELEGLYDYISVDSAFDDYIDDVSSMLGFRSMQSVLYEKAKAKLIKNLFSSIKYLGSPRLIRNVLRIYGFNVELFNLWTNDYKTYYELPIDQILYQISRYKYLSSYLKIRFVLKSSFVDSNSNVVLLDNEMYEFLKKDIERYRMSHQVFLYDVLLRLEIEDTGPGWHNPFGDIWYWIDPSYLVFKTQSDDGLKMDSDDVYMDKYIESVLSRFNLYKLGNQADPNRGSHSILGGSSVQFNPVVDMNKNVYNLRIGVSDFSGGFFNQLQILNSYGGTLLYVQFPRIEIISDTVYLDMSINFGG